MTLLQKPNTWQVVGRPMIMGGVGLVLAAIGVCIAAVFDGKFREHAGLVNLAAALVVGGVALGFVAVSWGWYRIMRMSRRNFEP
jgi:cytochrome bd-type quinol oxidase subunit 1